MTSGNLGRAYREVDEEHSDRETVIRGLIEGQYSNPVRIVCFNTSLRKLNRVRQSCLQTHASPADRVSG
jgi:hypothetical protein